MLEVQHHPVRLMVMIFLVGHKVKQPVHTHLGLPEGAVDSDEEDEESCPSHDSFQELKDNVRECLEKEPAERNGDDISILMV